mmetsp:Transcript_14292/g.48396  ORF Transcript_14292/g.48396 Transcript_14292/m.48396 type:complete len:165 (-) Transcript_14292:447-941(-)
MSSDERKSALHRLRRDEDRRLAALSMQQRHEHRWRRREEERHEEFWRAMVPPLDERYKRVKHAVRHPRPEEVSGERADACIVCLDNLDQDSCRIVQCGHAFHAQCLQSLVKHNIDRCPVCREPSLAPLHKLSAILAEAMIEEDDDILTDALCCGAFFAPVAARA